MIPSSASGFVVDQLAQQGIPRQQAEQAVHRCVKAIALAGIGGYFTGQVAGRALLGLFVNPAAAVALPGSGGSTAMAYQVGMANFRSDFRRAVSNWNSGIWNESTLRG